MQLILTSTQCGSYLVAGYRGVGKTSLVERAIHLYNKEKYLLRHGICRWLIYWSSKPIQWLFCIACLKTPSQPIVVRINFGHYTKKNANEVFYSITNNLLSQFHSLFKIWHNVLLLLYTIIIVALSLIIITGKLQTHFFDKNDLLLGYFSHLLINFPNLTYIEMASVLLPLMIWTIITFYSLYFRTKIIAPLEDLNSRISYIVTKEAKYEASVKGLGVTRSLKKESTPLSPREAEAELLIILKNIKNLILFDADIIFLFDEIDKLSQSEHSEVLDDNIYFSDRNKQESRKQLIDELLSEVKHFITSAEARFFFIAGRDTLDSYYSERGSTNSLYESLFDQVFEVPSLLTDSSDEKHFQISRMVEIYVCKKLVRKETMIEKIKNIIISMRETTKNEQPFVSKNHYGLYTLNNYRIQLQGKNSDPNEIDQHIALLRNFINYLTFHSWGNPKRLCTIFEMFVKPISEDLPRKISYKKTCLAFSVNDQRSFILASDIFTLFQHQLGRDVSQISDKITVSSLSSLLFILRLHRHGFTRDSLHRMSEAINIHRSPEFNTVVDDLLNNVFRSYVRRVRNGMYRYRFNSGFEQELRYISHVDDFESASYNFSLDAMNKVKQHFEQDIVRDSNLKSPNVIAKAHITLGDMNSIEQSYNAAARHYSTAVNQLLDSSYNETNKVFQGIPVSDTEAIFLYVEAMLKYGDLEERRQSYNKAVALYQEVNNFIKKLISKDKNIKTAILAGDSKWDVLKQPYWAIRSIALKRSPPSTLPNYQKKPKNMYNIKIDPRYHFREGEIRYFLGFVNRAIESFDSVIRITSAKGTQEETCVFSEKCSYLNGYALANKAECLLIEQSMTIMEALRENGDKQNILTEMLSKFIIVNTPENTTNPLDQPEFQIEQILSNRKPTSIISSNPFQLLRIAAHIFEASGLHTHAAIAYIKIICYWSMALDYYKSIDEVCYQDRNSKTVLNEDHLSTISDIIDNCATQALSCINLSRQLESSQFMKTSEVKDFEGDGTEKYSDVFNSIIGNDSFVLNKLPNKEFLQYSLLGQKLLSSYLWWTSIRDRLKGTLHHPVHPNKSPPYSIRFHIFIRWNYARHTGNQVLKKITNLSGPKQMPIKPLDIFETAPSEAKKNGEDINENDKDCIPNLWKDIYQSSSNLYFSLSDIRLISRNNLDLIFPFMLQIYYFQWKLLYGLMDLLYMVRPHHYNKDTPLKSTRQLAKFIQKKLLSLDVEISNKHTIAPTFFDYEFVTNKAIYYLKEAGRLMDKSSRVRTSILQQKYYFHDDHGDPEFHLDWTIAHMLAPTTICLKTHIEECDSCLKSRINEEISSPTTTNK